MLVRKKKKHLRPKIIILCFVVAAIVLLVAFDSLIKSRTKDIAMVKSESYAESVVTSSVSECMSECDGFEFVSKQYSGDKITAIEVNSEEVNAFKQMLTETINDKLSDTNNASYKINLAAVLSSNLLGGIGPSVSIYFQNEGSVDLSITSDFSSAGINQTIHRIYATISLDILAVTPSGSYSVPFSTEYVISETVVIGDIPQAYATITDEEKIT
ncbi:MAG: hypothetical protein LUH57_04740 [Ruminococcus sp.]|nr:hypothetical protein [Ruminococcus sp.]